MGPKKTSGRLGMDPYSRLLRRFYEPLILLRVLGQTRGTHTLVSQDDKSQSRQFRRRRLLRNLSYLCDYEKGGDTTSSIALEDTDQCYIFWIASNTARAGNRNLGFLKASLEQIRHIIVLKEEQRSPLEVRFTRAWVNFAERRVKKEVKLLSRAINECKRYINKENSVPDSQLGKWLQQFIPDKGKPVADICFQAYDQRKTPEFRSLEGKTYSGNGDIDPGEYESLFATVHHRLGRLAHHVRAPKEVIEDSLELAHLFDAYEICLVNPPLLNPPPSLTELHSIVKRMLPDKEPKLEEYIEALVSLDHKYHIGQGIHEEYNNKNFQLRVHAEVQVLEHFCTNQLRYVDNDHYIGCSKPSCYCCHLYFRHHKSRPVEPESHQKIYLNWGVPALPEGSKSPGYNMQRDLMNEMVKTIRKDALAQIIQKAGPLKWHPDSLTGITISTTALPPEKVHLEENPLERQLTSSSYDSTMPEVIPVTDAQSRIAEEWSSSSLDNDNSSTCEPQGEAVSEFHSDSDSDGGASL
ncbi:hypothetical protein F4813DRAFT_346782 [Daldinia decipiens]|uniref:uncharacterized protein n=1 Tax=Daldinia decipiens TaxID=326647 RepID=UPI0020C30D13|nr:uncharacterized protein F4813DRAFT_346782 [Daldinia decipiens]KAI1661202.1 hypothetical protein F4813DRAFT_346782 [Daldinia decipiens]